MKIPLSIILLFCLISFSFVANAQQEEDQGTTITFFIQQDQYQQQQEDDQDDQQDQDQQDDGQEQDQQDDEYMQITLEVRSSDMSLVTAINQAQKIIDAVKEQFQKFDNDDDDNDNDKDDDDEDDDEDDEDEDIQIGNQNIQAKYQMIRKAPTFISFIVTREVVIKVRQIKNLGKLVDNLLKCGVSQIKSLQWQSDQESQMTIATFKQGFKQAQEACENIGQQLDRIIEIEEVEQQEEQEDEENDEEQQQQEQEQQQEEATVYRFEILCKHKPQKSKRRN